MIHFRTLTCLLLPCIAWASPAPAAVQSETGSLIDRNRDAVGYLDSIDSANSAQVMIRFARCVARRSARTAEVIVAMPYRSAEQAASANRVVDREGDGCLGDNPIRLSLPPQLLVGGMAEHFILGVYGHVQIDGLIAMDDEQIVRAGLRGRNAYEVLSLCVVRRDPAAARALIGTQANTDAERAVINRIIPHMAPCIPRDFQMTFSRGALRALIATGVYRVVAILGSAS